MIKNNPSAGTKNAVWIYPGLFLLAALTVLFTSTMTSPLYKLYGGDSSIFIAMGKAFVGGQIPYKDFFDHKGPVLIMVEAIGQMLAPGKTGIFYLQILNLFLTLVFLYKTACRFISPVQFLIPALAFLFALRLTIIGGNSSEELSLLFSSIAIYIIAPFLKKDYPGYLNNARCFTLGLCFTLPFWIRANNAGTAAACVLFLIVLFIKDKHPKALSRLILFSSLAFLSVTGCIVAYFSYHNALPDMLDAAFFFNFRYMEAEVAPENKFILLSVLFTAAILCGHILFYLKTKNKNSLIFLFTALMLGIVPVFIGRGYTHYLILTLPLLFLSVTWIVFYFDNYPKRVKLYFAGCIILVCAMFADVYIRYSGEPFNGEADHREKMATDITASIPQGERKQVYCYLVHASFYVTTDILPYYKYFIFQEGHAKTDPGILPEINTMISTRRPEWIVTETDKFEMSENRELKEIINREYELSHRNEIFALYRHVRR